MSILNILVSQANGAKGVGIAGTRTGIENLMYHLICSPMDAIIEGPTVPRKGVGFLRTVTSGIDVP
jgi:hypothetical protein